MNLTPHRLLVVGLLRHSGCWAKVACSSRKGTLLIWTLRLILFPLGTMADELEGTIYQVLGEKLPWRMFF